MAPQKVCFFLNAQAHMLMHTVPIAIRLSHDRRFETHVVATTAAHIEHARAMALKGGAGPIRFLRIGGRWLERAARLTGASIPPKLLSLAVASRHLKGFDAVVLPERTSLLLRRMGCGHLRFVHTTHGAGDRAVGFDPRIRQFDFVLLAGEKQRRRMLAKGLLREGGHAVVGYPKFDAVALCRAEPPALFRSERPVVLYNPHSSRALSSWEKMGEAILRQAAAEPRYNLIVAPHIKRFDRQGDRLRAERLLAPYSACANIHIDLGSSRCIDMTYAAMADIYLGDVSSQVYEFLAKPRPCLFLNAHGVAWRNDENYAHWRYGRVLDSADRILDALDAACDDHSTYLPAQQEGFQDTFDMCGDLPSARAAQALAEFLLRAARDSDGPRA
ncbi:sensor domain-containing protein [Siccirubricoccus sp. KC 17139]|uniref:Sensor domain-containing protein n=1 Tax=Siccirubricoccus soli TaxID=2899147 RepID=A0ABT1D268_9PROT|nr:sensor domain-containing protein [Siccirubricoccus soli]MCP2682145.1 sensor domain-containing protein [Siccirubricoccus soli]